MRRRSAPSLEIRRIRTLAANLRRVVAKDEVPVLALRLPDLERTAWRRGRGAARRLERRAAAAFTAAGNRVLRGADLLAHDDESEIFLAALLDRARERTNVPSPTDCRNALRRLSAALRESTGLDVESGWTIVASVSGDARLRGTIERALERGARERERYDFFTTVGHELRTPLTSIRGYLETLLDEDLAADAARHFLEVAHAESLRLARLLDGMFEISLLDTRILQRNSEVSDVAGPINQAVEALLPLSRARGVTIALQPVQAHVCIDSDHLVQIAINLVENAIKHGRAGGNVAISSEREDDRFLLLHVDDDGPGVLPQEREGVFSLSCRGTTNAEGSGIGLAFVRLMAERIGGDVAIGDAPIGGARFTLRLPLAAGGPSPLAR